MSKNSRDIRTPNHKKRRDNHERINWRKKPSTIERFATELDRLMIKLLSEVVK